MKNKTGFLSQVIIIFLFSSLTIFPWGEKGHRLISKMAVNFFPADMQAFSQWRDYLEEHAPDPDYRKREDKTEAPKHYIDIDFYKEFNDGKMIENRDSLTKEYGEEEVIHNGILPWATLQTFQNLTKAFKDRNKDEALKYAADLGHYVADGHQPMHTVMNYNGQLTDQRGVHSRYEIKMIDEHLKDLENSYNLGTATYVNDPLKFIFNYISSANSVCPLLFDADNYAFKKAGDREGTEYYNMLWFKTKYITEVQFNEASLHFADLIYTAWINAGKPAFDQMK